MSCVGWVRRLTGAHSSKVGILAIWTPCRTLQPDKNSLLRLTAKFQSDFSKISRFGTADLYWFVFTKVRSVWLIHYWGAKKDEVKRGATERNAAKSSSGTVRRRKKMVRKVEDWAWINGGRQPYQFLQVGSDKKFSKLLNEKRKDSIISMIHYKLG